MVKKARLQDKIRYFELNNDGSTRKIVGVGKAKDFCCESKHRLDGFWDKDFCKELGIKRLNL